MDREITSERVIQMVALFRDGEGSNQIDKMIRDLDPWGKDELIWKLLVVTDLVMNRAAEGLSGEEILWSIMGELNGLNETKE